MTPHLRPLLLAVVVLVAGTALARADMRFGTVDMNGIFSEYYKTKDAQSAIDAARKAAEEESAARAESINKKVRQIDLLNAELQKTELGKEAHDAKLKERQALVADAGRLDHENSDFRNARQKALQDQYLRMRKEILEDIIKAVNGISKQKGYDMVFDKSGLASGAIPLVIASREELDFSQEVIATLNKAPHGAQAK
jgi:outer membrane protein